MPRLLRHTLEFFGTALLYVVAARIGLVEPHVDPAAATVWLPAGIALSALLLTDWFVFPAILAGALVVEWWNGTGAVASFGIAAGNTIAALAGAWLARRLARGHRAFERPRHIFALSGAVVFASAPIAASIGVVVLLMTQSIAAADVNTVWVSWWLADLSGALVVVPVVVLWTLRGRIWFLRRRNAARSGARGRRTRTQPAGMELILLTVVAIVASPIMFTDWPVLAHSTLPLQLGLFPILGWAALRFGVRETALAVALFAGVAVWGTIHGHGPLLLVGSRLPMLALQIFVAATSITALAMAAVVDERNRRDSELHLLAITDPLTGLANYRHLTNFIEREIQRSQRSLRPFSILLLDVNNLKTINDHLGHNVGSRLLVRLADALRASCRVSDLIARYGGDEFAVVLPGCDEEAARVQAKRLEDQLAADPDPPTISVSLGIAVFPRDGEGCDDLLDSADNELYTMKGRSKKRSAVYPGAPPA